MNEKLAIKSNRYLGAIHIHSEKSDGSGSFAEICRAAKKAGLDWIIITDHDYIDGNEGFINGVCVIKGVEISPENNHYLAFGVNKPIDSKIPPKEFISKVQEEGGFGFAAHPDESVIRKNTTSPIRWLDKTIKPDGVEIWNWFSSWADNYSSKNIFTIAFAYLFRHALVKKPNDSTLLWWDELNNDDKNIVPAIGGIDAHALKINKYIIPVKVFPYDKLFKTITNVIYLDNELSKDFETAKSEILNSIKEGQNLIVNRSVSKEIPLIFIYNKDKIAHCGENITLDGETFISIRLGKVFSVKILCDGETILEKKASNVEMQIIKKGKYRVEISKKQRGYTYSNPISVN